MENHLDKKVKNIKHFYCGYCINNLKFIYKKEKFNFVKFPALVLYFEHNEEKLIFDTGYSKEIKKMSFNSMIYNLFNPTVYSEKNYIVNQLKSEGIEASQIDKVILSHLHPDHIGGLNDFSESQIIVSKETNKSLNDPKDKLIFKKMISKVNKDNLIVMENTANTKLSKYFEKVYDLYEDESILLVELDGHSKGQLGIYFSEYNTFYIADALWGSEHIDKELTFISSKIQNNYKEYKRTVEAIKNVQRDGIRIIASHEYLKENESGAF